MQFYRDMYVSPEIQHPGSVKRRLQHSAGSLSLYVITVCGDASGQLQFFSSAYLRQPFLKRSCPMILGIAEGRANTIRLVEKMFRECYEQTGGADLIPFLAKRDTRLQSDIPPAAQKEEA